MPYPRRLALAPDDRTALEHLRDTAPKPYLRERAAALLKIADGLPAAHVARTGLLRPRDPDTVYAWLDRYQREGLAGLRVRPGRGRKPAFPPLTRAEAREQALHLVRRAPRTAGLDRTRWRLADLLGCLPGWRLHTPQGLGRLLHRLGLSYQRGRAHIHSPDPAYVGKVAEVRRAQQAAQDDPAQVVLFLDEMTLYRQPTIAPAWEATGRTQPRAARSQRADTPIRILGALDATTGQVQMHRADRCTVDVFVRFLGQVAAAYPGQHLTVVLDNWPVHFHPDVLCALEPQTSPFPLLGAANWSPVPSPQARRRWGDWALPIQLRQLPSYAPWTNPIEKVWRKLRQDLGHLHPYADDLPTLRARIDAWVAPYQQPSEALLRYVGLMPT